MPPRKPTLDILDTAGAIVRAQTPDDAALNAMFGPPADGERIGLKLWMVVAEALEIYDRLHPPEK